MLSADNWPDHEEEASLIHEEKSDLPSIRSWRGFKLVLLAWIAMLGFDFFLHGGLLAGLYLGRSAFLLPPAESFRRIPIGYLSFFVAAVFLVWIVAKIEARGWRSGLVAGAAIGGAMWISLALGLFSISTASPQLLLAWAAGQTVEMAYAGALAGQGLVASDLRRLSLVVILATAGFLIVTIVIQSAGWVPLAS